MHMCMSVKTMPNVGKCIIIVFQRLTKHCNYIYTSGLGEAAQHKLRANVIIL